MRRDERLSNGNEPRDLADETGHSGELERATLVHLVRIACSSAALVPSPASS